MTDFIDKKQDNNEIDLLGLIKTIKDGRKTLLKWILIFTSIGLFIALFSPKEYTASTIIVPQTSGKNAQGGISSLAAMAGIDLSAGVTDGIPPNLYPKIINSVPFKMEMLDTPLKLKGVSKQVTFREYLENHQPFNLFSIIGKYTIGLPGLIIESIKGKPKDESNVKTQDGIINISKSDYKKMRVLSNVMSMRINDKEGFVEIAVSMPEPLPAAQMTARAQKLLQAAITDFKVKKAKEELEFIKKRYEEAKNDFVSKQITKASFQDRNRGVPTALFATTFERQQTDFNIAYGVYSELSKKYEAQKIKVKEDTPVFTVIEPVSVPVEKSKPKRALILVIWTFLGVVIGFGVIFGKGFFNDLKSKMLSQEH